MIKRTFFIFGLCFGLFFCLFFSFLLFLRLRLSLHLVLFALLAALLYFGLGVFVSNSPRDRVSKDHSCLRGFARFVSVRSGFEATSLRLSS